MARWNEKKLGPKPPKQVKFARADNEVFDNIPAVAPEAPCASLYDDNGMLPPEAQAALAKGAAEADAKLAALPKKGG